MRAVRLSEATGALADGATRVIPEAAVRRCIDALMDLPSAATDRVTWLNAAARCVRDVWNAGPVQSASSALDGARGAAASWSPLIGATPELGAPQVSVYSAVAQRPGLGGLGWMIADRSADWALSTESEANPSRTVAGMESALLAGLATMPSSAPVRAAGAVPAPRPDVPNLVLWCQLPSSSGELWLACVLEAYGLHGELALSAAEVPGSPRLVDLTGPALVRSYQRTVFEPMRRMATLLSKLTLPQTEVARLLVRGLTEAQIGVTLHRSKHTIHDHVKSVYQALNVSSRIELLCQWHGLTEVGERQSQGPA